MNSKNKAVSLAARQEEAEIARNVLIWVNRFPELPDDLYSGVVLYERLASESPCMALSTIQGTYITKRYIMGGYQAEYQFKVIYRIKPGDSLDIRLSADEMLNRLGDWALTEKPYIGGGLRVLKVEPTTRAALFDAYNDGSEDHQILMKLTYEVI